VVENPAHPSTLKIGVATAGLIGGSVALRAKQAGAEVMVWHHNDSPQQWAKDHEFGFTGELKSLCEWQPDVLIVASPLNAMADVMSEVAKHVRSVTTVTDAGSVKEKVLDAVRTAGIEHQYVGAHPMAGNEKSGFGSASSDLLQGATWAVTVTEATETNRVLGVLDFAVNTMGGRVLVTDPITHDDSVSLISHLPHVLAHALTAVTANSSAMGLALALAAGSFRDVTRVARENPDRNLAMITTNHRAVLPTVTAAAEFLNTVRTNLERMPANPKESTEGLSAAFHAGDRAVERYKASGETAHTTQESVEVTQMTQRLVELCAAGAVVVGIEEPSEQSTRVSLTLSGS